MTPATEALAVAAELPRPAAAAPITVQCIDDAWGFTALRPRWNELLRASASDNPFLTWEWLHTWWAHLGGSSRLRLIVVRSGEEIVAIAPFCLTGGSLYWFSRLEFLGTGYAGSDYLDVIIRRGREAESLDAIARFLRSRQLAVRLTHMPAASFGAQLASRLAVDGWAATPAEDGTCPVIPLAGHSFDSYLATLGSSHRANVRRRLKALGQKFDMRFERVTNDRDRVDMLALLAVWTERRFKDEGGATAFITPEVRAFQDEVTRRAMERGWLRIYALRLNGDVAAVMYGFQYGGRFYFYQHGYDDRHKEHSIGLVLMALTIRAAIDEDAREFDMLWGVEPYKFLWAREARTLTRVDLFPLHFGGTIHRRALEARRGVKKLARRVLSIGDALGS